MSEYYTYYKLEDAFDIVTGDSNLFFINEILEENLKKYYSIYHSLGSECTWYNHDQDMINLSKEFPNIVFVLEGWGQNPKDIWRKYYHNKKVQRVKGSVSFEPFDMNKLKD